MILAYREPANPNEIFDELIETFNSDLWSRLRAQLQLPDSQLALSHILQEINEHLKIMPQNATLS